MTSRLQQNLDRVRGSLNGRFGQRNYYQSQSRGNFWGQAFQNVEQFAKDAWLDIAIVIVLGITCAGVWVAPHTFTRYFPVTFFSNSGDIVFAQFAYPYMPPPLSSGVAAAVSALVPLATFLLLQFWIRDFQHIALVTLGLVYSLLTGTLFQVVLKKTIGGLRPHFLTVCEPLLPLPTSTGVGFQEIMFTVEDVCRGNPDKIKNAMESFPSGHANIAWAGLGYLALYLATQFEVLGARSRWRKGFGARYQLWRVPAIMAPMLLAMFIASGLVLSYNHHAYDVIAGGLIGSTAAILAFRIVFLGRMDEAMESRTPSEYAGDDVQMRSKTRPESTVISSNGMANPDGSILPR